MSIIKSHSFTESNYFKHVYDNKEDVYIFIIILIAGTIGASYYFLREATYPKVQPYEKTFDFEAKENNVDI